MEYRPCIDIHNGKVKQIVGASLQDEGDQANENFVSKRDADFFADFYAKDGLKGGHVIMLNKSDSPYYEATRHIVLDLSARRADDDYFIVTDRWQHFTKEKITTELLDRLSSYCDEFLIHAADVEGKCQGIEEDLVRLLGDWGKIPITYAGGISDYQDITHIKEIGDGRINITIGSALDLFGGNLNYETVLKYVQDV